jgi:hypothetical protein
MTRLSASSATALDGLTRAGLPSASFFNLMNEVMTQIPARFKEGVANVGAGSSSGESGMDRHNAELLKALDKEFNASDGGSRMGSW